MIGAELELGTSVPAGWAENASKEKIDEWRNKGIESTKEEMEILIQETSGLEYGKLMRRVSMSRRSVCSLVYSDRGLTRSHLRLSETGITAGCYRR